MARLDEYLRITVESRASDLHFSSNQPTRIRIDGDLLPLQEEPLTAEHIHEMFREVLSEDELARFEKNKNLDRSYSLPGIGNFRLNLFMTRQGPSAVMRTIPEKIPTLEQLGLPEVVRHLAEEHKGLILVTGPTGSGKSTTLAAMINYINSTFPYHILTAEDPVEFVHPTKKSLINQREIGTTCPSFADALKYALREDPDVILVGEMRDQETISLALTAAETGHLVFGTLHTRGAGASVDRIIDSFPANQQPMIRTMLSESLVAVISQALLKKAGGKGRVAAYEIMVVTHAISNLIREGKTFQIGSIIQTARKDGMILMDQHIKEMIQAGIVTEEEGTAYLSEAPAKAPSTEKPSATKAPATTTGASKVFNKASAKPLSTGTVVADIAKIGGVAPQPAAPAPVTPTPAPPATVSVPRAPAVAGRPLTVAPAVPARVSAPPPLAAGAPPSAKAADAKKPVPGGGFTALSSVESPSIKRERPQPPSPSVSKKPILPDDGSEPTMTSIPLDIGNSDLGADLESALGEEIDFENLDLGEGLDEGVSEKAKTPSPRKKTG